MRKLFSCTAALFALGAAAADPGRTLAEAEAKEVLDLYNSPRAAAHLIRLHALRDEVEDLNVLAQTYHDLLGRRAVDPLVRGFTRMLYADVERARGHYTKAAELLEPLGYIQAFDVVGAFDNEGKSGCDTDFGPEAHLDLKATYPSKWREATWRPLTARRPDGYVDLSAAVRPNTNAVVYAFTALEAPQETRVSLSLGVSGAFRLWVNGQLAASENRYNLPRPDQAKVAVRLRKGANRLLLKVCQEKGPLGFYLRQERGDGVASVSAALPDAVPPLEKGPPLSPQALPSLTSLMEREVGRHPEDAVIRSEFATVLNYFRTFDEKDHRDLVEAERAARDAPKNSELWLQAAALEDDDANVRRKSLETAVGLPGAPLHATLALARHENAHGHPERALRLLTPLVEGHPDFVQASLALAQAEEGLGNWPGAVERVEAAYRRAPYVPTVAREAARVARRMDRPGAALTRYRTVLGLRFDDDGSRRALVSLLSELGQVDEAAKELDVLIQQDPLDNGARLQEAELLAANGHLAIARTRLDEARALAPDEPDLHEREGRVLLQAGLTQEALAAFGRSLALRPQNPALKDVLRTLKGEGAAVGSQYAVDWKPLLAEAEAVAGQDAVYLVDNSYIRVSDSGLASRFHQATLKLFTQRGVDAFRKFRIDYAPDRQEIRVLRARITKPDGSVIDSYAEEEFNVNEPWTGMYYDAKAKVLAFGSLTPGDILDVQYRLEDNTQDNLLSDYWGDVAYLLAPLPKLRFAYVVDMPSARALYWNKATLPRGLTQAVEKAPDGRTLYRFAAEHLAKVVLEPDLPGQSEVFAPLHVSTYRTWDQVGRYYWGLVEGQLVPNEEIKKAADKALTGVDRKDEAAVVRALYDFVVTHTRYVALEFGIHGYKPYRVDRVLARKFGDCKDKASLLQALLKVAGVDSRLVLLRMRSLGALGQEPASLAAFNHAILYVPSQKLFLDGTAEFHGSSELPGADHGANALIVEPAGGSVFLTTPEATAEQNVTTQSMELTLKANGSAHGKGKTLVKGEPAAGYRHEFQAASGRKAALEQHWGRSFPGVSLDKLDVGDLTRLEQDVTLAFELNIPRYAEVLPNGLRFFPFGTGRTFAEVFAPLVDRAYDLVLPSPEVSRAQYRTSLPPGYSAADVPPDVAEETPFGRYSLRCKASEGLLDCQSEVAFTAARISVVDYPAFRAFVSRMDQAFGRKATARGIGHQTARR